MRTTKAEKKNKVKVGTQMGKQNVEAEPSDVRALTKANEVELWLLIVKARHLRQLPGATPVGKLFINLRPQGLDPQYRVN